MVAGRLSVCIFVPAGAKPSFMVVKGEEDNDIQSFALCNNARMKSDLPLDRVCLDPHVLVWNSAVVSTLHQ